MPIGRRTGRPGRYSPAPARTAQRPDEDSSGRRSCGPTGYATTAVDDYDVPIPTLRQGPGCLCNDRSTNFPAPPPTAAGARPVPVAPARLMSAATALGGMLVGAGGLEAAKPDATRRAEPSNGPLAAATARSRRRRSVTVCTVFVLPVHDSRFSTGTPRSGPWLPRGTARRSQQCTRARQPASQCVHMEARVKPDPGRGRGMRTDAYLMARQNRRDARHGKGPAVRRAPRQPSGLCTRPPHAAFGHVSGHHSPTVRQGSFHCWFEVSAQSQIWTCVPDPPYPVSSRHLLDCGL
jgi:hypothetical protein